MLHFFSKRKGKQATAKTGDTGLYGEEVAAAYLLKNGYTIIERNYRKRFGEIDIVAEDTGTVVFVEVKTRKTDLFGSPFEAVDVHKQKKMSRAALAYLNSRHLTDRAARFDVVAVLLPGQGSPKIDLVQNAFDLCYE